MKCATIFVLLAAMLVAVSALPRHHDPPKMPRPSGNPHFGGYGSFNPRGRRSPGEGKITVDQPINGKATVDGSYTQKVYEGKYGKVEVYGSGTQTENQPLRGTAGVHAEIHFGGDDGGWSAADEARMREIDRIRKELKID